MRSTATRLLSRRSVLEKIMMGFHSRYLLSLGGFGLNSIRTSESLTQNCRKASPSASKLTWMIGSLLESVSPVTGICSSALATGVAVGNGVEVGPGVPRDGILTTTFSSIWRSVGCQLCTVSIALLRACGSRAITSAAISTSANNILTILLKINLLRSSSKSSKEAFH